MQEKFYIGQIFEQEYPTEALEWCKENNARIMEIDPITKEVEEEYQVLNDVKIPEQEQDGQIIPEHIETKIETRTRNVEKELRRFEIQLIPETPKPTNEEIRKMREMAYIAESDPISAHISYLQRKEQTPEIVAEIAQLEAEQEEIRDAIKERFPYYE